MEEQHIINKVLQGDVNTFGVLVQKYSKMAFAIAFRMTKDYDNAHDICQDAFIAAFENLSKFKQESKFSTWLYRIVFNKSLAFNKQPKLNYSIEDVQVSASEDDEILHPDLTNPQNLKDALNLLNEVERLFVELFYFQDQSIREISQIANQSESNTKVILHRARKKMNNYLTRSKFASQ